MLRSISEVEKHLNQVSRDRLEEIIDEYYDSLGLDQIDSEWLSQGLEGADIRRDEDFTFIIPRQLPTDTLEQIGMTQIGQNIGESLVDEGHINSYSVVGAPLTDKMYGRNAEKRGYAFPAVVAQESVQGTKIADINDGYSIGSHTSRLNGDTETVDSLLGFDVDSESLRSMHGEREIPIVDQRGDFTDLQRMMISEMLEEDLPPEIIGAEFDDGKLIGLRYNSETGRYHSLDEDREMVLDQEQVIQKGILLPEDNYESLIFPLALHPDVGYMLKGLENDKFMTEQTNALEEQIERRGISFPFIDASSSSKYSEVISGDVMEELRDTRYGASSSLDDEALILNSYPSASLRENLEEQEFDYDLFEDVMSDVIYEVYEK